MSRDRRLTPANGRVAADWLRDEVTAARYVKGQERQVAKPTTTIWRNPRAEHPERELLFGDRFLVLDDENGFAFGQSHKDGYCGHVRAADLGDVTEATHVVSARSSTLYPSADIKLPYEMPLSFGSWLCVAEISGRFARLKDGGHVPAVHLRPLGELFTDPAGVAELFLGAPYIWGGNSSFGLDCSGMVQAALLACGIPCPGDSDLQERALGRPLPESAPTERGDLFFWKGHVAMALDGDRLIHANAHTMSVAIEPIAEAIARIAATGDGRLTARRRL